MKNKRKLSNYLIDTNYQGKFLLIFGCFGFLKTFFFFYALSSMFDQIEYMSRQNNFNQGLILSQMDELQSNMYVLFGGVFCLLMVLFLALGFRFTHRTAGALFKFRKSFDEMAEKKQLEPIRLREGDFFQEVAHSFNDMVAKVKSK